MIRLRWPWYLGARPLTSERRTELRNYYKALYSNRSVGISPDHEPTLEEIKKVLASEPCDYPHCETRWKGHCDRSRLEAKP